MAKPCPNPVLYVIRSNKTGFCAKKGKPVGAPMGTGSLGKRNKAPAEVIKHVLFSKQQQ
jgi:hypothetical protein